MSTALSASPVWKYPFLALCFFMGAFSAVAAERPHVTWLEGAKLGTMEYIYSAETPDDLLDAKLEDQVEIWPADCAEGRLSRITKVFLLTP